MWSVEYGVRGRREMQVHWLTCSARGLITSLTLATKAWLFN